MSTLPIDQEQGARNDNHQSKTHLSESGVQLLDAVFSRSSVKIPTLGTILDGAKRRSLSPERRQGKKMLEISFIITTTDGQIMISHRDSRQGARLLSEKNTELTQNYSGLKKGTNLTSISIKPKPVPASYADLIKDLNNKIPRNAFLENPIKSVNFLGIAKNQRTDEHTSKILYTYYFYIFELKIELKNLGAFKKSIEEDSAVDTEDLENLVFLPLGKDIINVTASNYYVERAATLMLLRHHGYAEDDVMQLNPGNPIATYRMAQQETPFDVTAGAYFISHARADKKKYLSTFTKRLKVRDIKYWIQDEHAQRGENWDIANKSNIPLCKAFICAETPKTRNNKNVLDEIALAMEAHTRYPEYQIFRIQSSNFYNFDDKSDTFAPEDFRKSLLDILKDEALVEYYMNLTVEIIDMENLKNPDVWDTVINNLPK